MATTSQTASTATKTFEGAPGFAKDAKTELFLRGAGAFAGQNKFYETGDTHDQRMIELARTLAVTEDGWNWLNGFLPWLRGEGNMRTSALIIAVESVKARLDAKLASPRGHTHRALLDSVMQRADEPGEMLAYWTSTYGRSVPKPVKRAVADAAQRLYNEYALLKYDSDAKGYRFGDVLELTHPSPADSKPWQGDLFRYAIDRRHNRSDIAVPESLRTVQARKALMEVPVDQRRAVVVDGQHGMQRLAGAGMTWEALAGWLQGPMDADAWKAIIPNMGTMALVRNLRNFDEAKVDNAVARKVADKIADPDEVKRSRQLPFRYFSAYKNVSSLRWGQALEEALGHSLANVPSLDGRTLILVDRSPSMFPGYFFSTKNTSDISLADKAAVFGSALALRAENPTLVEFGGTSKEVAVPKGGSVLKMVESFGRSDGTDIPSAVRSFYRRGHHTRVVIITDEQTQPGWLSSNMDHYGGSKPVQIDDLIDKSVPVYMWNLAGYSNGAMQSGTGNRHLMGGLQDSSFRMIPMIEKASASRWPWESEKK
jgi:hypothetical protein